LFKHVSVGVALPQPRAHARAFGEGLYVKMLPPKHHNHHGVCETDDAGANAVIKRLEAAAARFGDKKLKVTDQGADHNGQIDSRPAFRKSLQMCDKAGGVVQVPSGTYLLNGPIELPSNTVLEVQYGARIVFSDKPEHYLQDGVPVRTWFDASEVYSYSPFIRSVGQRNVGIRGHGTIDGQGLAAAWDRMGKAQEEHQVLLRNMVADGTPIEERQFGQGFNLRPNLIEFQECERTLVEGITILNPPMWTNHQVLCKSVVVRNITVKARGLNNDGFSPNMCTDVLVDDCYFYTSDDGIGIKSGYGPDARHSGTMTTGVVINHCQVFPCGEGARGGLSFSPGCGASDIFVLNSKISNKASGVSLKASPTSGGVFKHLVFSGLELRNIKTEGITIVMDSERDGSQRSDTVPPVFSDIRFNNLRIDSCKKSSVRCRGLPSSLIAKLSFTQCSSIRSGPMQIAHTKECTFDRCSFGAASGGCLAAICSVM